MFKKLLFCLSLLLLCASCALADSFDSFAPVTSYELNLPEGVVQSGTTHFEDGLLSFTIDTDATAWDQVVTYGYDAASGEVSFSGRIPDLFSGEKYFSYFAWQSTEDELRKHLREDWTGNPYEQGDLYWSWPLGVYDADKQLFLPEDVTGDPYLVAVGTSAETAKLLRIEVRFTHSDPQQACVSLLPKDCIQPDSAGDLTKPVPVSNGSVRYTRKTPSTDPIVTRFTLPGTYDTVQISRNGGDWTALTPALAASSDAPAIYSVSDVFPHPNSDVLINTYRIRQFAGNKVSAVYSFSTTLSQGSPKLWPEHLGEPGVSNSYNEPITIRPFEASRLSVSLSENVAGLSAAYTNGLIRLKLDKAAFAPTAQVDLGNLSVDVPITPHPDAKAMGFAGMANPCIYGNSGGDLSTPQLIQNVKDIDWSDFGDGHPFFREIPYHNGTESYFTTPFDYTGEYSGMIHLFYWYDKENPSWGDKPFLIEYIAKSAEPYAVETSTDVVEDESGIPSVELGKPFLVTQVKEHTEKEHVFHAKLYPTGENRHYYELQVLNPNGKEVPLNNAACKLYLPYPPGYSSENAHLLSFTIRHFNKKGDYVRDRYSTEDGTLTITPYGLCIHVDSLSPFTLEWTDADAAIDLPQTGDSSRLLLWAFLLLAAGCAAAGCARTHFRHRDA